MRKNHSKSNSCTALASGLGARTCLPGMLRRTVAMLASSGMHTPAGDSMQEAPQSKIFDKLLCLCLAPPDTSVKLGKPVSENLWGPVFQELHVWGTEQKQVVQSGGARHHDV